MTKYNSRVIYFAATGSAVLVALSLLWSADAKTVIGSRDEAINKHLEEGSRILHKRFADEDDDGKQQVRVPETGPIRRRPRRGSTTTTTTGAPTTATGSSMAPHTRSPKTSRPTHPTMHGSSTKSPNSSTTPTAASKDSSTPPENPDKKSTTTSPMTTTTTSTTTTTTTGSPSTTTRIGGARKLAKKAEKDVEERKDEETAALDYAIAGINSWLRALEKNKRVYNRVKAGEFLSIVENKLQYAVREPYDYLIDEFESAPFAAPTTTTKTPTTTTLASTSTSTSHSPSTTTTTMEPESSNEPKRKKKKKKKKME